MNKNLFNPSAPKVEKYRVEDKEVYVVRDDLCSLFPGPNFSKIRGLYRKLEKLHEAGVKAVASQDTSISRCGWGVSCLTKEFDMTHYNFYPEKKVMNFYQRMSQSFGGVMVPIYGTFSSAFRAMSKKWMVKNNVEAEFLPIGLSLPETIYEHIEIIKQMSPDLFTGSLFTCVSSGTICAAIVAGIETCGHKPKIVRAVTTSPFKNRKKKIVELIRRTTTLKGKFEYLGVSHSGWNYKDKVKTEAPFPCDMYLDRKAWEFMKKEIFHFKTPEPIVFWNIGGEWNPVRGLGKFLKGDGNTNKWDVQRYFTGAKKIN